MLLSCSYDDTIKVWQSDGDDYYLSQTLEGHASTVWDFAFSPDGNFIGKITDVNSNSQKRVSEKTRS